MTPHLQLSVLLSRVSCFPKAVKCLGALQRLQLHPPRLPHLPALACLRFECTTRTHRAIPTDPTTSSSQVKLKPVCASERVETRLYPATDHLMRTSEAGEGHPDAGGGEYDPNNASRMPACPRRRTSSPQSCHAIEDASGFSLVCWKTGRLGRALPAAGTAKTA